MKSPYDVSVDLTRPKPRLVYEVDKSDALAWAVYEHEVLNDKIVSTKLITKDIKIIAKKKLEYRMFMSE